MVAPQRARVPGERVVPLDEPKTPPTIVVRATWIERVFVVLLITGIVVGILNWQAVLGNRAAGEANHRETQQVICESVRAIGRPVPPSCDPVLEP